jgi:signal transduction histidine kinase
MAAPEMESLHKLKSYFIANITHEFRTPLSAISASVEYLLEEMDRLTKPEIKDLLASVDLSVSNLQTLVDNLLESASIESGHFRIFMQPIEIMDAVNEAVATVTPIFQRREQKLVVERPDVLPLVKGDQTRLAQVLVNLLSNASKFGPIGQTVTLILDTSDGAFLKVWVIDQGPGISIGDKDDLFQRFAHNEPHGSSRYGIGLGLSIVKAIVEEHGGAIGVDEGVDTGALFWFTVPCVVVTDLHSTNAVIPS